MLTIKDKRVQYALMGGAALILGYAAYCQLNSQSEVDIVDSDLE